MLSTIYYPRYIFPPLYDGRGKGGARTGGGGEGSEIFPLQHSETVNTGSVALPQQSQHRVGWASVLQERVEPSFPFPWALKDVLIRMGAFWAASSSLLCLFGAVRSFDPPLFVVLGLSRFNVLPIVYLAKRRPNERSTLSLKGLVYCASRVLGAPRLQWCQYVPAASC